jgi:hypothetical protein
MIIDASQEEDKLLGRSCQEFEIVFNANSMLIMYGAVALQKRMIQP